MKAILAALMIFTSTAMAGWGDAPTWKELEADPNIEILWPSMYDIKINDLCVANNEFRTVRPVRYCAEQTVIKREACTIGGEAEVCRVLRQGDRVGSNEVLRETYGCASYGESSELRFSRTYTQLECVKWSNPGGEFGLECLEERLVTKPAPLAHMVPYQDKRYANSEAGGQVNYKRYTIVTCK